MFIAVLVINISMNIYSVISLELISILLRDQFLKKILCLVP